MDNETELVHSVREKYKSNSLILSGHSRGQSIDCSVVGPYNRSLGDSHSDPLYSRSKSILEPSSCASALQISLKSVEDFVRVLQSAALPGPVIFIGHHEYLGRGSQFTVYKEKVVWPEASGFSTRGVAVKQPRYIFDSRNKINHSDPDVRKQVHEMYLEIVALTHPVLKDHPNIINLLGWGKEETNWHAPLLLVMELAVSDLKTFLDKSRPEMSWETKYELCLDIGAGLDVIHDCHLIHGDLKPENVLITHNENGPMAKIADFGLCIDEEGIDLSDVIAGTPGWQAPEIEERRFHLSQLTQADNYSYGLIAWSVMLLQGTSPPTVLGKSRSVIASEDLQRSDLGMPESLRSVLLFASQKLLIHNVLERPLRVWNIIFSGEGKDERSEASDASNEESVDGASSDVGNFTEYEWEIGPLSSMLFEDLSGTFKDDPTRLPGDVLFTLALQSSLDDELSEDVIQFICVAAHHNYWPAQAVLASVFDYYGESVPTAIEQWLPHWSMNAVATGSVLAARKLELVDKDAFCEAVSAFRRNGGFNQFYSRIKHDLVDLFIDRRVPKDSQMMTEYGHNWIHWLAVYASCEEVLGYLDTCGCSDINTPTDDEETALYLACVRGQWDVVKVLLARGADPSIACTYAGLTCLHWLFNFDETIQLEAAQVLIEHGAEVDAMSRRDLPFFHYPFILPRGSALHWAVALSCRSTIQVLIDTGANLLLRNRCDPYLYDDRVRPPCTFRFPEREPISVAVYGTLGITPLDVAAIIRDPFVFQYLVSKSPGVDVNDVDEEGFTALHRLAGSPIGRTRLGNTYDGRMFLGKREEQRASLRELVAMICILRGDINKPIKGSDRVLSPQDDSSIKGYSPLMLAMQSSDLDLMAVLIECGANVRYQSEVGMTALQCKPLAASTSFYLDAVKLLLAHGANIQSCSAEGETALLAAVFSQDLDVVEYLLEKGGSPDQINHHEHDKHLWTFLATRSVSDDGDHKIASLLERHVVQSSDSVMKKHILEYADEDGASILHYFSFEGMIHCVDVLLAAGCDVNKLRKKWTTRSGENGGEVKTTWYMTPLDMIRDAKKVIQNPDYTGHFSSEDRYELNRQTDCVAEALRRAGGIEAPSSMRSVEHTNDDKCFGRRIRGSNP